MPARFWEWLPEILGLEADNFEGHSLYFNLIQWDCGIYPERKRAEGYTGQMSVRI